MSTPKDGSDIVALRLFHHPNLIVSPIACTCSSGVGSWVLRDYFFAVLAMASWTCKAGSRRSPSVQRACITWVDYITANYILS